MEHYEAIGTSVYAREEGRGLSDGELMTALRAQVPELIVTDPDDYRTTRELVVRIERLALVIALGQRRDRRLWYSVMAVGRTPTPPPEYPTVVQAVGLGALQLAVDEGDFEDTL